jgi:hypothetical protein
MRGRGSRNGAWGFLSSLYRASSFVCTQLYWSLGLFTVLTPESAGLLEIGIAG